MDNSNIDSLFIMRAHFSEDRRFITIYSRNIRYNTINKNIERKVNKLTSYQLKRSVQFNRVMCGYLGFSFDPVKKKPTGTLLVSLLNTDFSRYEDFISFIKQWGYLGLLDCPEKEDIFYKPTSTARYIAFLKELFNRKHGYLCNARQAFSNVINICLNIENKNELLELTPAERLYVKYYENDVSPINETNNYDISHNIDIYEYENDLKTNMILELSKEKNISSFNCREELVEFLRNNKRQIYVVEMFYTNNIVSLCYLEYKQLLLNFTIKMCSCGKYFIPQSKNNEVYCAQCKHLSYDKKTKVKGDIITSLYRQAYKNNNAIKNRRLLKTTDKHKQRQISEAFLDWDRKANSIMTEVRASIKTEEEFIKFLETKVKWGVGKNGR